MTKTEIKTLKRRMDRLDSCVKDVVAAFESVSQLEQQLREKYERTQKTLALHDQPKKTKYPHATKRPQSQPLL